MKLIGAGFMKNKIGLYMITKPESAPYLELLEETLNQNNFPIIGAYPLRDWESISKEIYAPQLAHQDINFKVGYEGHIWLTKHLFGNRSTILLLEEDLLSENLDIKKKLIKLYETKQQFRNRISHSLNGTLRFNINLDKLEGEVFRQGGNIGYLGTFREGRFTKFSKNNFGRWEDFFLKYVHSPDPDIKSLIYEWSILTKRGLLKKRNLIKNRDWELMKKLKTQIPPSEYGG